MADRFFAIDDQTFLFPDQVRDAYAADIQAKLNAGVTATIAGMPDVVNAITTKVSALTAQSLMPFKWLAGSGIDPTGSADSTTAVRAFLNSCANGDTVMVPAGSVIKLTGTITLNKRIRLTGGGELRWTAGIANTAMIDVTTDGCHFDGLHLTNPNYLAGQTGNRTYGIHFQANSGRVIGCRIVGQQQAIAVEANGEWHDFVFDSNLILDVPGSGDGPNNTTSAYGEDRGDGITVWGAAAVITNNRVHALDGTDARVGIHVEQLASFESTGYNNADSMCTIAGNVVTGKFRRGITNEGLSHVAITGNAVADATWYGINLVGTANYTTVTGNTIKITRTSSDQQGQAWSPIRAGIMVYDNVTGTTVSDNVIASAAGSGVNSGIAFQVGSGGNSVDCTVQGNTILGGSNQLANGVAISNGSTRTRVLGNRISGFSGSGITADSAGDFEASGNYILGSTGTTGIGMTGSASNAKYTNNTIRLCTNGIRAYFRSTWVAFVGNVIEQATTGIDMFNSSAGTKATLTGNTFATVTTTTTNMPTGTVSSGNN